jgi:la-related protein 1
MASWDESQESMEESSQSQLIASRKQFDATTPTLVDEEDYADAEEEQEHEMLALASRALASDSGDDNTHRRTPGASVQRNSSQQQQQQTGLGYALTSSWEAFEMNQARTHNTGGFSPALLRLTEDIGNLLQEDEDDDYTVQIPSLFRADKDDAASASEGTHGGASGSDWAGAFSLEKNSVFARKTDEQGHELMSQRGYHNHHNNYRRRVGTPSQAQHQLTQTNTFLNAQQPIPRRGSNEVFEFGKTSQQQQQQQQQQYQSPQMIHLGGAFAPPAKDNMGMGRSVPFSSAPIEAQASQQAHEQHFMPHKPSPLHPDSRSMQQHQGTAMEYSASQRETPIDAYFQVNQFASPSPNTTMSPSSLLQQQHAYQFQQQQQSEMVATAQEFVPMSTRSETPQYPPQMWSHPAPIPFDISLNQSWQSSPFGIASNYSLAGAASFDARSAMTPSPHMPVFQQGGEVGIGGYRATSAASGMQQHTPSRSPYMAPIPSHQQRSQPNRDHNIDDPPPVQCREASTKNDNRRGKRGKKKITKGSITDQTRASAAAISAKQPTAKTQASLKKRGETSRPGSATTQCNEPGDEIMSSTAFDEAVDSRRAELNETPAVRLAFKNFYKAYRTEEQKGVEKAEEFAKKTLEDDILPRSIHWRVYIELADLARRTNRFAEARRLYQKVCILQPYASQGWLEYSKLEEECGNMNRVANILYAGLEYCEYNENLMIRAIKHQEKMGKAGHVRALLGRLKHISIEKVWRTILEGAMFEARAGNIVTARRALKYIMHYIPWYGPLYIEFYRLERDHGHPLDALAVVERGLAQIPRYGPLWFSALRVCEELDHHQLNFSLPRTTSMLMRASVHVSKEIVWKVHLEAAFLFERAATKESELHGRTIGEFLAPSRHYFALTIRACRLNLRWKVWLAAARMELAAGNTDTAIRLFFRAHEVAPEKVRSLTFLDYARFHEFIGESDLARAILCRGRVDYGDDWKVWLESVLLEMRAFNLPKAFELATSALVVQQGTGRLWSALVQLSQYTGGVASQHAALRQALNAVPKSGEVWCEGARMHLNPFSGIFDIDRARRHLFFAGKFTPQYGDSFLETVRVELLRQWLLPIADFVWEQTKSSFKPRKRTEGTDNLTKYITDISLALSLACQESESLDADKMPLLAYGNIIEPTRQRLATLTAPNVIDLSDVALACSNADPNYGPLWFYCRRVQTDASRCVIDYAASCMTKDLRSCAHVYLASQIRRHAILSTVDASGLLPGDGATEAFDSNIMEWEDRADALLQSYPSLQDIYNSVNSTAGLELLETTINEDDFVTGLMEFNKHQPLEKLTLSDRRRAIFATDALFP